MGQVSLDLDEPARAREFFRRATLLTPKDVGPAEALGEALRRTGALSEALEVLNRAYQLAEQAELTEQLAAIDAKLARVFPDSGEYEAALARVTVSLARSDRYAHELLLVRGWSYLTLGRAEEALEAAKAAEATARRQPLRAEPRLLCAHALTVLKRYSEAVSAADEALQYDPSDRAVLLAKAQALIEGQTDLDKGQRLLKRYAKRVSDDELTRAISFVLAAREKDGNAHHFLGQLRHATGHPQAALQEIDLALELGLSGERSYPEAPAQQLKAEL